MQRMVVLIFVAMYGLTHTGTEKDYRIAAGSQQRELCVVIGSYPWVIRV